MVEAYVRADYLSIEKPFIIEGREHTYGETERWTIARVSTGSAKLIVENGLSWWNGEEPDWDAHDKRIALMKAQRDKAEAEKRIAALGGATP